MDTKSESWQLQRNKFTSRERGYSSNTSSWYKMILFTLTLLLTSQKVGLADRGNKNEVNSVWVMFWYYWTWARFRRRSFHELNLIH